MWPVPSMQFCLGHKPWLPCYVVRLQGTTVMLDCALDLSTLLNFLPLVLPLAMLLVSFQSHPTFK